MTPSKRSEEPCGRDRRASKSEYKQPVLFKVFSPITLRISEPVAETTGCNNYEYVSSNPDNMVDALGTQNATIKINESRYEPKATNCSFSLDLEVDAGCCCTLDSLKITYGVGVRFQAMSLAWNEPTVISVKKGRPEFLWRKRSPYWQTGSESSLKRLIELDLPLEPLLNKGEHKYSVKKRSVSFKCDKASWELPQKSTNPVMFFYVEAKYKTKKLKKSEEVKWGEFTEYGSIDERSLPKPRMPDPPPLPDPITEEVPILSGL